MYRVTREIEFCYGHRLLNYAGKCKYLHGHNGKAEIHLESATLDDRGMVIDFTDIKRSISAWIDENWDHKMLLHREDPLVPLLQAQHQPLFLLDVNPTAENMARLLFQITAEQGFPVVEVRFHETPRCVAAFGSRIPGHGQITWSTYVPSAD